MAQLQAAWAALVIVMVPAGVHFRLPGLQQAEVAAFGEQAARDLLALQPDNPHSSFAMGSTAVTAATTGSAPLRRNALPHYQRGAELARAQGNDFWLARWAGRAGLEWSRVEGTRTLSGPGLRRQLMGRAEYLLTPFPSGVAGCLPLKPSPCQALP